MANINPKKKGSFIKEFLEKKLSKDAIKSDNFLTISFRHLDNQQGASLQEWSESGFLLSAVNRLKDICCSTLQQQIAGAIAIYGSFPVDKSAYYPPKHVPEDANWGRVHVDGTHILAGHFVENTFYVVFLDNDHSFYKVSKKHT